MNTITLIGRLCYDTETSKAKKGDTVYLNNVIAVPRDKEETDFIPIVAFNGTAEFIDTFFKKGDRIGVVGRLTSSTYEDEDGTTRRQLSVIVTSVDFCESSSSKADTKEDKTQKKKVYKR